VWTHILNGVEVTLTRSLETESIERSLRIARITIPTVGKNLNTEETLSLNNKNTK
jgi:hypothetical protein